jgi:hypothetical protein
MKYLLLFMLTAYLYSCQFTSSPFAKDLAFLRQHDSVLILSADQTRVIVSPKYQAKVFTSTGDGKQSFGWINYSAFDATLDAHMNAFGGENRLWLGPEGNRYSLFFPKGKPQTFGNWKTPAAFDHEPWDVLSSDAHMVALTKKMQLVNYAGSALSLTVSRRIKILDRAAIGKLLRIATTGSVVMVGYQTENIITNTGSNAWDSITGAPCLWILDMFPPSDQSTVVIPYRRQAERPITADYFGTIPAGRLRTDGEFLYFRADGKQRGKLGISPAASGKRAASYDAINQVLTIVVFDTDSTAAYLNQQWDITKPALSGDAINAYNDGPLADGKQMGPFYELESVSPAAFLKPGGSLSHDHSVFHFSGNPAGLDAIASAVLGIGLDKIRSGLKQH